MRVHIVNSFYIDIIPKGYVLKEEYEGRTKEGRPRTGERNHGFYSDIASAVKRCLELNTMKGSEAVELWQYAKMVEESNKRAVNSLKREIELLLGGMVK